jgi:hypothetical protein
MLDFIVRPFRYPILEYIRYFNVERRRLVHSIADLMTRFIGHLSLEGLLICVSDRLGFENPG